MLFPGWEQRIRRKECIVYLKRSNNYLKLKESSGVDIPQEIAKKIESNGSVVPVEQEVVKTYLYIETIPLTAEEAANLYGFDAKQREQLGELLLDRNKDMWDALLLQQ